MRVLNYMYRYYSGKHTIPDTQNSPVVSMQVSGMRRADLDYWEPKEVSEG